MLSSTIPYGDVVVNASEVVWAGLLNRGGQPIALTISNVSAPTSLFVPVSCNPLTAFRNFTTFTQFTTGGASHKRLLLACLYDMRLSIGCTRPAPPAGTTQMILVNVRLWTQVRVLSCMGCSFCVVRYAHTLPL